MMKTRIIFVALLAAVLAVSGAAAAPAETRRLSLEECLDLALKNNPDILRAEQELGAARGRSLQAAALPNPELVARAEGLALKKNAGEKEISLGLEQRFEFPGKRALRRAMGGYEEQAAAQDLDRVRLLVRARVKSAYFQAAADQQRLVILQAALEDLKSYTSLAQARYAALQTSSVDVSRGLVEELKVRVEVVDARKEFQADLASLFLSLGLEPGDSVPVLDGLQPIPPPRPLEEVLRGVDSRPSLKADGLRQSRARAGLALAGKTNLPDFTLGFYYPSLRTAGWGISFQAALPLFGKRQRGEVEEAAAVLRQSEIELRAHRTAVETSVKALHAEISMLGEKLALYDASLLRETEQLIQSALRDYQYGKLDSLGLLDFYRTWRGVKGEHLNTLLRYAQASAELEVAGEAPVVEE